MNSTPNILDKIVAKKKMEISSVRKLVPVSVLEESELFLRECHSLREFLLDPERNAIIAEFKRKSPSKGVINNRNTIKQVTTAYARGGASAISVLTDRSFFGGRKKDLSDARRINNLPVLRKDFMLEEYQIVESKSLGADIILLIASILNPVQIKSLAQLSKHLGMNVLLEVHSKEELDRSLCDELDAVGVNNRNLGDFSVSLDHSFQLAEIIPDKFMKISESGISDPAIISQLKSVGYNGFLIGENFMKTSDPGKAFNEFSARMRMS